MLMRGLWLIISVVALPIATFASTPPALPLQTGQNTCYDSYGTAIACAGTGQDAEYQAGIVWPNPRFVDNNDQTITDNLTGLVWTKNANPADGAKTWQQALDYIKTLNNQNYLGHNDWRLPNSNELESQVNRQQYDNFNWLNSQGFSNVQPSYYWSSSSVANNAIKAWSVNMYVGSGYASNYFKDGSFYVWPVRGGQLGTLVLPKTGQTACYNTVGIAITCAGSGQDGELQTGAIWPSPRFSDNGNQTVTDNLTGLIWSKDAYPGGTKSWQGALDYIKTLNSQNWLGFNDWRLPNRNELKSLVNKGPANLASWPNSQGFTNVQAQYYWSSTSTYGPNTNYAWTVYVNGGYEDYENTSLNYYVWPVHGGQWDALTTSPKMHTFSNTIIGNTPVAREFTIANSGQEAAIVSVVNLTGADADQFAVAPGGVMACPSLTPTLAIGESCTIQVVFIPTSVGAKSAKLHIAYNGAFYRAIDAPLNGLAITTIPLVTGFTTPATATSLVVSITSFTAVDDIAVAGYCVTESNNSASCLWSVTKPTSYTFSGITQTVATTKTLSAFAKDAAGNVSTGISASVVITLPDTTAPTISVFTLPATSSTLTVPITTLAATDNVGVNGYCISEANNANACTWLTSIPASYTFAFAVPASKTLYAWTKDSVGNVSTPATATVTITLPDTIAPTVIGFAFPATSSSLTVPVSTLTAMDNVAVTGYLLSEIASQPQPNDPAWSATAPTSYTFSSEGTKVLYAWAKDATGNVSQSLSSIVSISQPVNGSCGTSNGGTFIVAPVTNLCSVGTPTAVSGTGPWNWTCTGSNSGTTATCNASFQTWTITSAVTGGNGTATCTTPINNGATFTCTITPAIGYQLATFSDNSIDKKGSVAGSSYNITNVTANHAIAATFTLIPPTPVNGSCGTSNAQAFTIAPTANLCSAGTASTVTGTGPWSWSCDGTSGGTTATCNASIQAWTITATVSGGNGTVTCTSLVNNSATSPCTVTPATGYQLATFTDNSVDKKSSVAGGGYNIANVIANHTVAATFSLIPPAPVNAVCGSSNGGTFTIVPTTNFCSTGTATAVTGTGPWNWTCSGTNGGTTATCSANIATSTPIQFTVTPTTGSGYTITPATPQTINNNATTSFTVTQALGFGIVSASGCSGSLSGSTYTTGPITANCTISVTAVARNANSGSSAQPPTITDALKVLQAVVGIAPLSATEQIRYDVAPLSTTGTPLGNGIIDAADVIAILRRSIGIGSW